jgi:diacylglycerol O-acyltransferase / trehalose O-mycolyltransferase
MRRARLLAVTTLALVVAPCVVAPGPAGAAGVDPASPGCVPRSAPPAVGLTEISSTPVDARVSDYSFQSAAMGDVQHVDVMLPAGYASSDRRYPVLYLLHGSFGTYHDWVDNGVEQLIGNLPLIVVMPDDGPDGSYSDWYGNVVGTTGPVPAWETYHTGELIPWIDAHLRTIADRSGRFIAGLSSGGAGAIKYAAANPGMFGAAGSFSGADDTDLDWPSYPAASEGLWLATLAPGDGPDGHCTWGDPVSQQVIWRDNDPTYLAGNLAGTPLFLASGDGQPGPYDDPTDPSTYPAAAATETVVWQMNQAFVQALDAAGVPHTDYFYGAGTHSWPYWKRDLTHFLAWLTPYLSDPAPAPASFAYRSARPSFSAWGWQFSIARDVREFVYLSDVSPHALTASGSGTLSVTTPALYTPGAAYAVGGNTVRADEDGRLSFAVELGPSHETQQYVFTAPADTAGWDTVTTAIAPAR